MAGIVDQLRQLHRLHRSARDLRDQLERLPQQMKIQKAKLERHEKTIQDAHDHLKKLKVGVHEREVTLKTLHQQIKKHEKQREESSGKKEYDALQLEINTDVAKGKKLEDEILTAMMEIEERTAALPALEKSLADARAAFTTFEATAGERKTTLSEALIKAAEDLKAAEQSLPDDIRAEYDRSVKGMGSDALSPVHGDTCVACSTSITAQRQHDLLVGKFVVCRSCGRMLYLPE
jgi:predicted  nucleic acid-binding Zn-ribbon protein